MSANTGTKGKHSGPRQGHIYARARHAGRDVDAGALGAVKHLVADLELGAALHQVTSPQGVRMLMVYSPAGTEGMFAAMHALSPEQLMDAELTKKIALAHDTVMVEAAPGGRGKGTILG